MTLGTVIAYNASRGTGTLACASGARLPFASRDAQIAIGDRVRFSPTGGLTGPAAARVERAQVA